MSVPGPTAEGPVTVGCLWVMLTVLVAVAVGVYASWTWAGAVALASVAALTAATFVWARVCARWQAERERTESGND